MFLRRKQCKTISSFSLVCWLRCGLFIKMLPYNSDKEQCLVSLWSSKNWNWKPMIVLWVLWLNSEQQAACAWWFSKAEVNHGVLWLESAHSRGSTCSFRREGLRECSSFMFDLRTNPVNRFGLVILCLHHHEEVVPNKLNLIQDRRARTRIKICWLPSSAYCAPCSSWLVRTKPLWESHCYKSAALLKLERLKTRDCESLLVSVVRYILPSGSF